MKKRLSLEKLTNRLTGEKHHKPPRAIASPTREWQWLLGIALLILLIGLGGIYKTYISFNTEYSLEVDNHGRIVYPSEMVTEAVTKYEERKKLFNQNLPEPTDEGSELEGGEADDVVNAVVDTSESAEVGTTTVKSELGTTTEAELPDLAN